MTNVYRDHRHLVDCLMKSPAELQAEGSADLWNLAHIALGIMGEGMEYTLADIRLDYTNLQEEAGDILFFLGALETALQFNVEGNWMPANYTENNVLELTTMLGDTLKKHVIYKQPLRKVVVIQLARALFQRLAFDLGGINRTTDQIRAANIEKLRSRYPAGSFSNEAATIRADKKYRHKKRGTVYTILVVDDFDFGDVAAQDNLRISGGVIKTQLVGGETFENVVPPIFILQTEVPLRGPVKLVYYKDADGDGYYARPVTEFMDGRFEEVE